MPHATLERFRLLHERRKRGALSEADRPEYEDGARKLTRLLLVAQQISTPRGRIVRSAFRAAYVVDVDLADGRGTIERTKTLDVSASGFAVLVTPPFGAGGLLRFTFRLSPSSGAMREISGTARVASRGRDGAAERIGFVFVALAADARDALDAALIDFVLARLDEVEASSSRAGTV